VRREHYFDYFIQISFLVNIAEACAIQSALLRGRFPWRFFSRAWLPGSGSTHRTSNPSANYVVHNKTEINTQEEQK
jgi:hypothetical protein